MRQPDFPVVMVSDNVLGMTMPPSELSDSDWCREFRDREYPGAASFDPWSLEGILDWEDDPDKPDLSSAQRSTLRNVRVAYMFTQRYWLTGKVAGHD